MKTINVKDSGLAAKYVSQAQRENVVLTERGSPVLVLVGIRELDDEQIQFGLDDRFWKLITKRRKQPTISHEEMKRRLGVTTEEKPHTKRPARKAAVLTTTKTKRSVVKP